jgi:type II secretory ATPase GspE/PulE/Tfp pilus assembly ATPase PilB-like protein
LKFRLLSLAATTRSPGSKILMQALATGSVTILDILVSQGLIQKNESLEIQEKAKTNQDIEKALRSKALADDEKIARSYAQLFGFPYVTLAEKKIPKETLLHIPKEVAQKYEIVAFELSDHKLSVAIGNPGALSEDTPKLLKEIGRKRKISISLAITTTKDLETAIKQYDRLEEALPPKALSAVPKVDLSSRTIPSGVLSKFPEDISRKYEVVVFAATPKLISIAAVNPDDPKVKELVDFVRDKNKIEVKVFKTDPGDVLLAQKGYEKIVSQGKKEDSTPSQPSSPSFLSYVHEDIKDTVPPIPTVETGELPEEIEEGAPLEEPIFVGLEEKNLDKFLEKPVKDTKDLEELVKTGFVPKIVAAMLSLAAVARASDIHLEPQEADLRLRFRIDGILRTVLILPLRLHPAIVSRVKILSKLKIDEQRIPQDGRFDVKVAGKEVDLRISTLPTVFGEKLVMRLLDKSSGILTMEQLGLIGGNYDRLLHEIEKPFGVILATGPTGSGKSTTLYAILQKIATAEVNVITLEDPVEYEIPGINQSQIKPKIGYSFAEGLRSILRQDPNIIMVGEIRDAETAGMVTHAALTGHLVLSTLHTNDASGALPRLINMGVEPFLITSAMNAVLGQRLVRKVCENCKGEAKLPKEVIERINKEIEDNSPLKEAVGDKPLKFYKGGGCKECDKGYRGRVGLFEVLVMSPQIEDLAIKNRPASEILTQAKKEGMLTMFQDGIVKAISGLTTMDEVFRVTTTE